MTRQDSSDVIHWTSCSPGTLTQLNQRLRATQQRKTMKRVAAPVLVLACFGFGVWAVNRPTTPGEFNFGGVTCTEVQSNMQQYAMTQLSPEVQSAFEVHLAKCPQCQKKMQAMQDHDAVRVELSAETDWENNSAEGLASHRHLLAAYLQ